MTETDSGDANTKRFVTSIADSIQLFLFGRRFGYDKAWFEMAIPLKNALRGMKGKMDKFYEENPDLQKPDDYDELNKQYE